MPDTLMTRPVVTNKILLRAALIELEGVSETFYRLPSEPDERNPDAIAAGLKDYANKMAREQELLHLAQGLLANSPEAAARVQEIDDAYVDLLTKRTTPDNEFEKYEEHKAPLNVMLIFFLERPFDDFAERVATNQSAYGKFMAEVGSALARDEAPKADAPATVHRPRVRRSRPADTKPTAG